MSKHYATIEPASKNYRVYFNDELILETDKVMELVEHYGDKAYPLVPYFSPDIANQIELSPVDTETSCPLKGVANYFSFRGVENALWSYRSPKSDVAQIAGYYGFDSSKGFRVESA